MQVMNQGGSADNKQSLTHIQELWSKYNIPAAQEYIQDTRWTLLGQSAASLRTHST